ncbi:SAM-dependent methyltransferase [Undibacterium cyanobacteriorum]|uniref:SAM-dependent methyltransferase n=1 Tax=Undibacterium cyanobacteriorum TaxID=3073561 RepID=A0ABY9RMR3_9BURK|nr:SAM-dependent methyltransferase [Undibacterium sp. 20NA77.5]WMW81281.1 SAM-dependent methyltransferase [Undibacterium sp. 20NA77.5]
MQKLIPIPHQKLALPPASPEALAASAQLRDLISAEIQHHGGVIPFSRYMEMALYTPGLGYYSGGSVKLGPDGDFTTAPELSSLFGASLAHFFASHLASSSIGSNELMEFGAGSGKLAYDILSECQYSGITVSRYFIVELSGELRARQEERLKAFPQVEWLTEMPSSFSGMVLGNEVLDAMPIELVIKNQAAWNLLGVGLDEAGDFILQSMPAIQLSPELILQIPEEDQLPEGYISEIHPVAIGFMRSVSEMLLAGKRATGHDGLCMWLDYGFPAHEYYVEQRNKGSLMCHYRHHAHPDPFYLPGLQDITAHVDFTAVARAGLEQGLNLAHYSSQAGFLLEAGITNIMARIPVEDSRRYLPSANALQKLISPAEMGELFKVLVMSTGPELAPGYARHDRRHRL